MNITKVVDARFDTANYELDRRLSKGKKKKSNCINERLIMWKNNDRVCHTDTKNIYLFNRR